MGNQAGEGWYLTSEMVDMIEHGCPNIICARPFACLPNDVVGTGMFHALRNGYPQANIVAVDYDAGASEVNQLHRIKLMISTAIMQEGAGSGSGDCAVGGSGAGTGAVRRIIWDDSDEDLQDAACVAESCGCGVDLGEGPGSGGGSGSGSGGRTVSLGMPAVPVRGVSEWFGRRCARGVAPNFRVTPRGVSAGGASVPRLGRPS